MDLGLKDRVAFVAGASDGLGLATATRLAQEGCRTALCSRNRDRIEAAAQHLRQAADVAPDRVLPLVCDVTDEAQIETAFRQTLAHFGVLNVLVTNAGGPATGYIDDLDAAAWRQGLELNLMSTINLCRHALPHLRAAARADGGLARILMISSVTAKQPVPNLYLSNTARAGVQGFAKSLSEELGREGITVNTILPGFTRTQRLMDFVREIQGHSDKPVEEIEAGWAEANALKRLGEPEEFAAAAAFLVSAPAAYITGVALPVDGGRIKHLL